MSGTRPILYPGHGSNASYTRGCRCVDCTAAHSKHTRDHHRHLRHVEFGWAEPLMVDAAEVAEHIRFLRSSGMDAGQIAAECGLHRQTVQRIVSGRRTLVQRSTWDRIMGVCAPDRDRPATGRVIADLSHFDDSEVVAEEAAIFGTKRCTVCGDSWPASTEFYHRDRCEDDGLKKRCRRCDSATQRREYAKNRQATS